MIEIALYAGTIAVLYLIWRAGIYPHTRAGRERAERERQNWLEIAARRDAARAQPIVEAINAQRQPPAQP